ncbi:MAG: TIGR03032 family protein, partial [bacterium]
LEAAQQGNDPELIFVNTRFSCLCRREMPYSFVPVWRPRFISAIAPEDRCHLNGMGVRDNRPRYVTALGETDTAAGWRENKKDGGILIDIETNEVISRGLSMPHSPRWYNDRLWVLNSGFGSFGVIEPVSGKYVEVARLPGFTRGLDFYGNLAFIGLSQVRESATFSGIEIASRPVEERSCGIWVVDINTGGIIGMVKFGDALQEIFAVQVIPRKRAALVTDSQRILADSFVLPDQSLAEVAEPFRQHVG